MVTIEYGKLRRTGGALTIAAATWSLCACGGAEFTELPRGGPTDPRPIAARTVERDLLGDLEPPTGLGTFAWRGEVLGLEDPRRALGARPQDRAPDEPTPREMTFDLAVAPDAVLELAGEVLSGPRTTRAGPIVFRATVGGETLFEESLEPSEDPVAFSEDVDLRRFAGRDVELRLTIESAPESETLSWWTRAWLVVHHPTPRRLAGGGGNNLLLVVIDTMRADHLGFHGYSRPVSPHLDRFAADAVVFDAAFSPSSWTQPSVASILTGLSPLDHGMMGGRALSAQPEVLGEVLQRAGFTTLGISSNPIVSAREGFQRGFEDFRAIAWADAAQVRETFEGWLAENEGRQWFAYVHFIDPHEPWNPPGMAGNEFTGDYAGKYRDPHAMGEIHEINYGLIENTLQPADLDYFRARYDGEVKYWDTEFGKLVERLRAGDLLDRTVVIVVGDHGEEFLEHGKLTHGFHLYDESLHVPLVVRAPQLRSGTRRRGQIDVRSVFDIALHLSGVRRGPPSAVDALFSSDDPGVPVFSQTSLGFEIGDSHYRFLAALRDGGWKYIYDPEAERGELYDLRTDTGERLDVSARHPEIAERYLGKLQAWLDASRVDGRPMQWTDPGIVDRLRDLGYVR